MLEKDTLFEFMAFVNQIIDRECIQKPAFYTSPFYIVRVFDILPVTVAFIAFDNDVEHLFDCASVVVECSQW